MMLPLYLRLDWCHHLKQKEETQQRFHYRFSSGTFATLCIHISASWACLTEHSLVGPTELWVPVTIPHYNPHQRNFRVPHASLTLVIMEGWCCYCLVTKSCLTPSDLIECSMPGSSVLHYLPEFAHISCPLGQWCYLTISSSVVPFLYYLQSFPASVFCSSTILICSIVWSQGAWFLQLCFSFSRLFLLSGVSCVPIKNCKIFCSNSVKNAIGNLIGISLHL